MKVILLKGVAKLGKKDEIVEVSDGYAHNALFPKQLAVPATPTQVAKLQRRQQGEASQLQMHSELLEKTLGQLKEIKPVLQARVNAQGHLFAKLNAIDIAKFLLETHRLSIPVEAIKLETPIKETGTFSVPVSFNAFKGMFTLTIEPL